MCRFLIAKSNKPLDPSKLLNDFAYMCEASRAPDGDRQEDGWGVMWASADSNWHTKKSLRPIWENKTNFFNIPKSKTLVAHARSAFFANQKGFLNYNQPFSDGESVFVFNGIIKSVKLDRVIPGSIGAQKIHFLVSEQVSAGVSPEKALKNIYQIIKTNSRQINGLNIGLLYASKVAVLCSYGENKDYFTVHWYQDKEKIIICSEPISGFNFNKMDNGEVRIF